jgi:hypothetical protein
MKKILDIYSEYKIMPSLADHQLRVASVAKQICDSITVPIDREGIVTTCLVHDMGNIIKFDLTYFPEFFQPEGLEYWQKVKNEFIGKYGEEEHSATRKIGEEIGLTEKEKSYLDAIGFSRIIKTLENGSLEQKICCYADQRVGPYGVISIGERIIEGAKRYKNKINGAIVSGQQEGLVVGLRELEKEIFSKSSILPEDINDKTVKPIISQLKFHLIQ